MVKSIRHWLLDICKFAKTVTAANIMVSGPGVKQLSETIDHMMGRGAPTVIDETGFNKQDYQFFGSFPVGGETVPLDFAIQAIQRLAKYQLKQVPHYQQMRQAVEQDVTRAKEAAGAIVHTTEDKKVKNLGQGQYAKTRFLIPDLDTKTANQMKKAVFEAMLRNSQKWPQSPNRFSGKMEPPVFRGLQKDKASFHEWEILPEFVPAIAQILKASGFDVTEMEQPASKPAAEGPKPEGDTTAPSAAAGKTLRVNKSGDDTNWNVTLYFEYNPEIVTVLKSPLFPKKRWNPDAKSWVLFGPDKASLQSLSESFKQQGYDITQLEKVIDSVSSKPPVKAAGIMLEVSDISHEGKFQIAIRSSRIKEQNESMKDALRYTFPEYDELKGMRWYNKSLYRWEIKGKRSQYFQLYKVLKIYGFDVTNLVNIVRGLLSQGKIEADRVPGRLDGYENEKGQNDIPKFDTDLDSQIKKPLYDKQKDGVRFLYGNTSAILGDETGSGKTFQLVSAALMRMKTSGGRTLIVTLPSTIRQWMQEITKLTGQTDISNDVNSNAKWVVVYYHMFQAHHAVKPGVQAQGTPQNIQIPKPKKRRDQLVDDILAKRDFSCLILDECHNVKNENISSENISKISQAIPFKWGASATFIANKPIDAYNQLRILGHPLGQLSKGRFKREFGGMVPEGYGGAYIDGPPEVQAAAAANLRKWMTQMGAYIKRTKKDINPDMPSHSVEDLPVDIDMSNFDRKVALRMKNYKDKELAILQMIAQRVEAALAKVTFTLDRAKNVLMQDKKVLVFTCFVEPAQELSEGLKKIVSSSDVGGGTVEVIVGNMDKNEVADAVARFKDPNGQSKAMVLSILKGGTGIDLPNVVEDVIINDFSWTPKDAEQSEGRAFRISSTSDVTTTYIVAQNSPDLKMYTYVQGKKELAAKIQNLEKKEMEYVLKGLSTTDLQKERAKLEEESKKLDAMNPGMIGK